jgi:hypothetical protein
MTDQHTEGNDLPNQPEALRMVYEEVCRAHDGIADFRGKLLALLPIASGAGIFLLLGLDKDSLDIIKQYLPPIGFFGVLVVFGLYLYELRGIQKCNVLTQCGKRLEQELLGNAVGRGAFTDDPPSALGFVGATWAARVIYPATIGAWTYVALCQVLSSVGWQYGLAGIAFLVSGVFGWLVDSWQKDHLPSRVETDVASR